MKILVLVKDNTEKGLLEQMQKGVQKTYPNFCWDVTTDQKEFEAAYGTFRISAVSGVSVPSKQVDLVWPSPSVFLRDIKKKESIWSDIQDQIVPALQRSVVQTAELKITKDELQTLLKSVSEAKKGFVFDHPDGFTIGVNTDQNVDTSLTSADISSMLAAIWIFGAKGVRLT